MLIDNPTDFRWEEPPAPRRRTSSARRPSIDWLGRVHLLRQKPGEWAMITADANRVSARLLEAGMIGGAEAGQVEARAVSNGRGEPRTAIYARWIGGEAK